MGCSGWSLFCQRVRSSLYGQETADKRCDPSSSFELAALREEAEEGRDLGHTVRGDHIDPSDSQAARAEHRSRCHESVSDLSKQEPYSLEWHVGREPAQKEAAYPVSTESVCLLNFNLKAENSTQPGLGPASVDTNNF